MRETTARSAPFLWDDAVSSTGRLLRRITCWATEVEVKDGIAFVHGDIRPRCRTLALELVRTVPGVLGAQLGEGATTNRSWVQLAG